jgi:hypothetical protein
MLKLVSHAESAPACPLYTYQQSRSVFFVQIFSLVNWPTCAPFLASGPCAASVAAGPPSCRAAPSPWAAAAAAGVAFPEVLLVEEVGAAAFPVGVRPSVEEEEVGVRPCPGVGRTSRPAPSLMLGAVSRGGSFAGAADLFVAPAAAGRRGGSGAALAAARGRGARRGVA